MTTAERYETGTDFDDTGVAVRSFYSVSTLNDRYDDGNTATFATFQEAAAHRAWCLTQGYWFVSAIWS